jgi:endonuclease/exonuclease/phosphatase family metal-dependent hydrolase
VSKAALQVATQKSLIADAALSVRVLTVNTHKGFSAWNRRFVLGELRDAVRSTGADIVFLQEVVGAAANPRRDTSGLPHYEYLADELWSEYAYGRNAVHPRGNHHGNALMSRYPIASSRNHDASAHGREPRGLLHCVLDLPGARRLHAICVHLGLREWQRQRQLERLCELVREVVPNDAPLLVAGDFNDWRKRADEILERVVGLRSAFEMHAKPPATSPARLPVLALDRIYARGVGVQSACVLARRPWPHLSDHLPLLAEVTL